MRSSCSSRGTSEPEPRERASPGRAQQKASRQHSLLPPPLTSTASVRAVAGPSTLAKKLHAATDNNHSLPAGSMLAAMRLGLSTCSAAELRTWTGLTRPHMHRLNAQLEDRAPDRGRGRPWALPYADRVLLLVLAYRTNLTMQQLGSLFGISDSAAHQAIDRLAGPLGPPTADRRPPTAGNCGSSTEPSSPSTTTTSLQNRRTTNAV
ncbi:helix-turn-helix domain-containing protein [Streptomyces shenzhenensis]|uniref:helix-turn-helix domain-containing protein n=1 Tax=Streptomyces shenzhenensis TaxID=943815 RepID=UPI003557923E